MVTQTATASDSPIISDSITSKSIGGTGNVGLGVSDSPVITDVISSSKVPVIITIDPFFAHLNGRDTKRTHVGKSTNVEKLAIVNITFPNNLVYTTGGVPVDFSTIGGIQRFKTVYFLALNHKSVHFYTNFVPDTNNDAKLGKIKCFDSTGTELTNGNTVIAGLTMKGTVRGA